MCQISGSNHRSLTNSFKIAAMSCAYYKAAQCTATPSLVTSCVVEHAVTMQAPIMHVAYCGAVEKSIVMHNKCNNTQQK
jgi:hypothetical protein